MLLKDRSYLLVPGAFLHNFCPGPFLCKLHQPVDLTVLRTAGRTRVLLTWVFVWVLQMKMELGLIEGTLVISSLATQFKSKRLATSESLHRRQKLRWRRVMISLCLFKWLFLDHQICIRALTFQHMIRDIDFFQGRQTFKIQSRHTRHDRMTAQTPTPSRIHKFILSQLILCLKQSSHPLEMLLTTFDSLLQTEPPLVRFVSEVRLAPTALGLAHLRLPEAVQCRLSHLAISSFGRQICGSLPS
jgi:hypothetical protein